jgi:hypothetical protein
MGLKKNDCSRRFGAGAQFAKSLSQLHQSLVWSSTALYAPVSGQRQLRETEMTWKPAFYRTCPNRAGRNSSSLLAGRFNAEATHT